MTKAPRSWRLPTQAQIEQAEAEFAEELRAQLEQAEAEFEPPEPEPEAEI